MKWEHARTSDSRQRPRAASSLLAEAYSQKELIRPSRFAVNSSKPLILPQRHRRSRAATKTSDGAPLPRVLARDPTHSLPLCAGAGGVPGPTSDQLFLKMMDKGPIRSREHSALQPQQNGCAPTFPRTCSASLYKYRSMLPSTSSADYTTPSPSSLKTSRCFHISSYMQSPSRNRRAAAYCKSPYRQCSGQV